MNDVALVGAVSTPNSEALVALYGGFVELLGNYSHIDLSAGDMSTVALPDCELTQHPPFMGLKKDTTLKLRDMRKMMASRLPFMKFRRDNVHVALHPEGKAIAVFQRVSVKLACFPCFNIMDVATLNPAP